MFRKHMEAVAERYIHPWIVKSSHSKTLAIQWEGLIIQGRIFFGYTAINIVPIVNFLLEVWKLLLLSSGNLLSKFVTGFISIFCIQLFLVDLISLHWIPSQKQRPYISIKEVRTKRKVFTEMVRYQPWTCFFPLTWHNKVLKQDTETV